MAREKGQTCAHMTIDIFRLHFYNDNVFIDGIARVFQEKTINFVILKRNSAKKGDVLKIPGIQLSNGCFRFIEYKTPIKEVDE